MHSEFSKGNTTSREVLSTVTIKTRFLIKYQVSSSRFICFKMQAVGTSFCREDTQSAAAFAVKS